MEEIKTLADLKAVAWRMAKRMLTSWTAWFNGFIVPMFVILEQNFHLLYDVLGPDIYPIAFVVVSGINVILRMKTQRQHEKELAASVEEMP